MPVARPESSVSRIIAHVDMDCFYVQVEQRREPSLRGLPSAVVQYNEWKGGGLIAVSYEARKFGVKRSMRGDEAKQVCPEIQLIQVPVARGKADLNTYRDAGSQVVTVLSTKGRCERASIDEVYLDLTDAAERMLAEDPPENWESVDEESLKSHILGLNNESVTNEKESVRQWLCSKDADHRDKLLACGTVIVAELRMQVLRETEFTCSAGIAHNKILAKLASGMNKPAQQTVVPSSSVQGLLDSLPIKKMKQLGGKLGSSIQSDLGVNTVGDLLQFTVEKLQERYGVNTGTWLWNVARGINGEEVQGRLLPKSHGSGKTFPGPRALKTVSSVQHWLNELCEDLSERIHNDLELNKRVARVLTLHVRAYTASDPESHRNFSSKSCPLRYGAAKMQEDAMTLFQAGLREYTDSFKTKVHAGQTNGWRVTNLSVSASKIVEIPSGTAPIMKYFHRKDPISSQVKQLLDEIEESASVSPSASESCPHMSLMEQAQFPEEHVESKCARPCLEEIVDKQDCFENQGQDDTTEEASMSNSGKEHSMETSQICVPQGKSASVSYVASNLNKQDHKRKASKDKGTNSILTFFKKTDCSGSSVDENVDKLQVGKAREVRMANSAERSEAWSYKADEIDTSVIDELPPEIQAEFRAWLHPHKRSSKDKTGSSIDHYFSPTRNTHL